MIERVDRIKQQKNTAAADARKEYYKRWRANNKDKVRAYNERYWERRAAGNEANNNVKTDSK